MRRFAAIPAHPQKQYTLLWRLYHFCGFYYPIREVIPIAIYHWNIGIVSRGKGKSAVAAAAYRSGEKLTNEWDGMTHDYTRKGGVVHTEIMLPPHAPPSFADRSTLWNSVELYEKAGNAQLAREIDAALPIELSREEQIRLVREYCSSQFVSRGMCVDFVMPEDAERQGIGTPATRAAILEKLVSAGFVERKRAKKTVSLLPTPLGTALITVLPEQLQSPTLTAEWEHRLKEVERGTLAPGDFMDEIAAMLRELVETCRPVEGSAVLFPSTREAVGRCPRCGGTVTEGRQGFFCENRACGFAIWKNSKWWENKKKTPTKAIVAALLKDGRTQISGLWSEKTGKTYTATVALTDDGTRASFRLEFSHE